MQKKWAIATAVAGSVAATAFAVLWAAGVSRFDGRINTLGVNWQQPAAYIATPSLVALVRDLVKAPVLRELLTEDFVFYYETHEDRLSAAGAIRRLAYEHDTGWSDKLLAMALDQPSELVMWADERGAARHWALVMTRDTLAQVIQGLGTLAAKDRQLTLLGDIPLELPNQAKKTQAVYALSLSARRTLALVAQGQRVVVLSDPGLLFDNQRNPDPQATQVLGQLLAGQAAERRMWRQHFGLAGEAPTAGQAHTLVASGQLLGLGYQRFMPALQAVRVDVAPGGASLRSWLRQGAPWPSSPWAALPAKAAACSVLPVNWPVASQILAKVDGDAAPALQTMARSFDAPAAICWYAQSQLHTPLLVVHANPAQPQPDADTVNRFMRWWLPQQAQWQPGHSQAEIRAPYGSLRQGDAPAYRSALRRAGNWWLFSPDATLVTRAEAAVARRYPAVADTLGGATPVAVVEPSQMATLLQHETLAVLPRELGGLRQAAETRLLPQLARFGKLPAAQVLTQGKPDAQGWVALQWKPLAGATTSPPSPASAAAARAPAPGTTGRP